MDAGMYANGPRFVVVLLLALAPAVGCSDPSRQTGTQVQVSEETKAQMQDMRDVYKDMGDERFKD